MATFSIPRTTFPANQTTTVGPWSVPAGATMVNMAVDRTISGGLNAAPASETLNWMWEMSTNGGPYQFIGGGGTRGGIFTDPETGLEHDIDTFEIDNLLSPSASRSVRGQVTNGNTQVAVSGTVTVT